MNDVCNIPIPIQGQHPGKYLSQVLEARGWVQTDLIFILGCAPKTVNLIINGKQGISPAMSKALGEALGITPDYFADLQKSYDMACANEPNPSISLRAKMQNNYPIREMIKRGWLEDVSAENLSEKLAAFFEVQDAADIPYLAHAAKKTAYDEIPAPQLAWLFRVRQIAKSIAVPKYNEAALRKSLDTMRGMLIAPEAARNVPRVLSEAGVRFIVVEPLPQGKIDGVCFWLDKSSPVIGISTRFDRIDNFWFVLRHEIEHVLQRHGQEKAMVDAEMEGDRAGVSDEEKIADDAAAAFCISPEKIVSFIKRKKPFFYEKDVIAFSSLNGVHPGLVVGQIQHRTKRYDYVNLKKHLVKIRQYVLPGTIFDGWGHIAQVST